MGSKQSSDKVDEPQDQKPEVNFLNKRIKDALEKINSGLVFQGISRCLTSYPNEYYEVAIDYIRINFTEFYKDCWSLPGESVSNESEHLLWDTKFIPFQGESECCSLNFTHYRIKRQERYASITFILDFVTDKVYYKTKEGENGECRLVFSNICTLATSPQEEIDYEKQMNSYHFEYLPQTKNSEGEMVYDLKNFMEIDPDNGIFISQSGSFTKGVR